MNLREVMKKARNGEQVLKEVTALLSLDEYYDEIIEVINSKKRIVIVDRFNQGLDALMYHALKNAGAISVPNYEMMQEMGQANCNSACYTIFINTDIGDELRYC